MGEPAWQVLLEALGDRLDDGVLPAVYRVASVPVDTIRAELDAQGLPYTDHQAGRVPDAHELETAAEGLIRQAGRRAAWRGAIGAAGGVATLGPEAAASLIQTLRLAQRLAVLYGHDPDSDRGRVLLTRALGAAWRVDLPTDGALGVRLRQLPTVVRSRMDQLMAEAGPLGPAVLQRAALSLGKRLGRAIPGIGTTLGAIAARRGLRAQGRRMARVYQRSWEGDLVLEGEVQEAEELP